MFGHKAKRIEFRDSGVLLTYAWGTFEHVVFKVILGSFDIQTVLYQDSTVMDVLVSVTVGIIALLLV